MKAAVVDAQNRIEVIGGTTLGDDPVSSSVVYVTQTLANYAPVFATTTLPAATAGVRLQHNGGRYRPTGADILHRASAARLGQP